MSYYNLEQPHALPHVPTETVYLCPAQSELAPVRLLGDIVATKTQFVIQNRLKAVGEWGDYSYRRTAEDAIEAARREAKWDDDHELNSYEYRAVIRITSDHVLSPNKD